MNLMLSKVRGSAKGQAQPTNTSTYRTNLLLERIGKLDYPLPTERLSEVTSLMRLEPHHRVLTIAAYGWGIAFLPACSSVIAIDADKFQIALNTIYAVAIKKFGRDEFERFVTVLFHTKDDEETKVSVIAYWRAIEADIPEEIRKEARQIMLKGRLDRHMRFHIPYGTKPRLRKPDIVTEVFPHMKDDDSYRTTAERITNGNFKLAHLLLPGDLDEIDGRFDRIFLTNVITFISRMNGLTKTGVMEEFLSRLRGILNEGGLMLETEHGHDGFFVDRLMGTDARVIERRTTDTWQYTTFC